MHGFEHPPAHDWTMPAYDEKYTPEERAKNFTVWITEYFPHPDLESKDFYKLILSSASCSSEMPAALRHLPEVTCRHTGH